LVVDPAKVGVSAFCYDHGVYSDAMREWKKYWSNGLPTGFAIQKNPESGYYGCVMSYCQIWCTGSGGIPV
jgi:hypothetical protein